jgi:hypothetical protein
MCAECTKRCAAAILRMAMSRSVISNAGIAERLRSNRGRRSSRLLTRWSLAHCIGGLAPPLVLGWGQQALDADCRGKRVGDAREEFLTPREVVGLGLGYPTADTVLGRRAGPRSGRRAPGAVGCRGHAGDVRGRQAADCRGRPSRPQPRPSRVSGAAPVHRSDSSGRLQPGKGGEVGR